MCIRDSHETDSTGTSILTPLLLLNFNMRLHGNPTAWYLFWATATKTIHLYFYDSSNPLDLNVGECASGRSGRLELLLPSAQKPTTPTSDDGNVDDGCTPEDGAAVNNPGGDDTPRRRDGNNNRVAKCSTL